MKFHDNYKAISQMVTGAVIQHLTANENQGEITFNAECIDSITKNKLKRDTLAFLYRETMDKVHRYAETGRIPGNYSDFQAQLCLDLGRIFK